jgi:putative phosphoribosyl transferase
MKIYPNREAAGRELTLALYSYAGQPDTIVLALPRGGVPVGRAIADQLHLPLDLLLVRKLGVPWQPELAFGAVAEGGACVLDQAFIEAAAITPDQIQRLTAEAQAELAHRAEVFRAGRAPAPVGGRTVLLIDDGLATGSTMLAAVRSLKAAGAKKIIVAVPVGPASTCTALEREVDQVICLAQPEPFEAVGVWYQDFHQLTDDEVRSQLR